MVYFTFGIPNLIIASYKYDEYINCPKLWAAILIIGILYIIACLYSLINIALSTKNDLAKSYLCCILRLVLTGLFIGINIYECIIYFTNGSECDTVINNMALANIIFFFIDICISIGGMIFVASEAGCCLRFKPKPKLIFNEYSDSSKIEFI